MNFQMAVKFNFVACLLRKTVVSRIAKFGYVTFKVLAHMFMHIENLQKKWGGYIRTVGPACL